MNIPYPKGANLTLWIGQWLLALFFALASGAPKLFLPVEMLGMPLPLPIAFVKFIGTAEVLGALGVLLPGLKLIPVDLNAVLQTLPPGAILGIPALDTFFPPPPAGQLPVSVCLFTNPPSWPAVPPFAIDPPFGFWGGPPPPPGRARGRGRLPGAAGPPDLPALRPSRALVAGSGGLRLRARSLPRRMTPHPGPMVQDMARTWVVCVAVATRRAASPLG